MVHIALISLRVGVSSVTVMTILSKFNTIFDENTNKTNKKKTLQIILTDMGEKKKV